MPIIPSSKEELTPEWFTSILELSKENQVKTVELQPLGEKDSVSGKIYRVHLTYTNKPSKNPKSVVLKLPQPRHLRFNWLLDAYREEVKFYKTLAHKVGVPAPKHIYSDIQEDTGDYVLVMEDFPDSNNVRDEIGATTMQTYGLLDNMARLHAKNWENPDVGNMLIGFENSIEMLNEGLTCLPVFLSRFSQSIEPEEKEIFQALPEGFRKVVEPLLDAPKTIVHNDYSMKNILILDRAGESSYVLLDWANLRWGSGVRDLCFFMMTSVPLFLRPLGECMFLRYYLNKLVGFGVSGYSFRQLFDDYRRCVIMDMARMVGFGGREWFSPMHESIVKHLIRGRTGSARTLNLRSLFN